MIRIEKLNLAVGDTRRKAGGGRPGAGWFALEDVSLHVQPEEYFVLLGPSGAGKTLLLECLCGLSRIDSGRILVGGRDVTSLEPRQRGLGYLPQDYALFPHKTVRGNIAFGLRNLPANSLSVRHRVEQLLEWFALGRLADRYPERLSGGEKQRVALARALAVEPKVLLLDEPVSALDEQTRDNVCRQLKQLQRLTRTAAIHVCHNFAEMASVADRVAVIDGGRILQVGTPRDVLERPAIRRVAEFVQAGNLWTARAQPDGPWLRLLCQGRIHLTALAAGSPGPLAGDVSVMVRPENVRIGANAFERIEPGTSLLEGTVGGIVNLGPLVNVHILCHDAPLTVLLSKREYTDHGFETGDRVFLAIAPEDVHVMEN